MIMSSTVWTDSQGNTRITLIRSSIGAGPFIAGLQALVNADWLECWEGLQSLNTPAPIASQYINANAVATMKFLCTDGTTATLVLYAPKLSIFLTDQVTIDPMNADVVSLITLAMGNLQSASGAFAVAFLGGSMGPRPQGAG